MMLGAQRAVLVPFRKVLVSWEPVHDIGLVGNAVMMLGAQRAVLVPFRKGDGLVWNVTCSLPFSGALIVGFTEFVEGAMPCYAGTGPLPTLSQKILVIAPSIHVFFNI